MRGLGVIWVGVVVPGCLGQVFTGLGITPGQTFSRAQAISADGSTVVGGSGPTPWRWTQGGGMQSLGPAPGGLFLSPSSDVSGDGSVVVGSMNDGNLTYAWRWTQSSGIVEVPGFGGGATFGPFVSADGSTIVGTGVGLSIGPAVRWTQATGVQSLNPVTGVPIGQGSALLARAVSADGSIIAGVASAIYITFPQTINTFLPFRWTQDTGSVGILNNGQFYLPQIGAGASDMSADGSVIVGYAGAGTWRWTAATGFVLVLNPPATAGSFVPKISGDGSTIAYRHLLWTTSGGEVPLTTALTNAGCNFAGWSDVFATDVSFNGRTLCGYGTNPFGQTEAWYATIPAPTTCGVLGFGVVISLMRRRGRG